MNSKEWSPDRIISRAGDRKKEYTSANIVDKVVICEPKREAAKETKPAGGTLILNFWPLDH